MEEQFNLDINLDFLDASTSNIKQNATTTVGYQEGQLQSMYDIESLASRIASVNELTVQLKTTKDEHAKLQKQMQDLSDSAMSIRCMYEREKMEKAKYATLSKELQEKCDQAESKLTNKTLHFEQLTSRIEQSAEKGPLTYNDLALRYQRLALQLDDDKLLQHKERITLQQIQEYIEAKKLTALPAIKKKSHQKKQVHDYAMQCNLKAETKTQGTQYTTKGTSRGTCTDLAPSQKQMCNQGTQYTWYTTTRGTNTPSFKIQQKEVRAQGTQYISSTTTRGTCTSAFIKKQSIGTNFPEVVPVSIEDILKEMICDVSPLSPLFETPQMEEEVEVAPCLKKIEMKSVSTNTELENIRKPIDYVPVNIKYSDSRPPSRNMFDRIKNESPFMGMPTMNPFAGLGISQPSMQGTVAELWNMLGHTIFALMQNGSAPLNPMHMNVVNDRMRNLSADINRRMDRQRSTDEQSNSGKDFFGERLNEPRDYLPATRSMATSPISLTGMENGGSYMTNEEFNRIYMNPDSSSSAFVPVKRSEDITHIEPNPPIEIQKILLNKSHQEETPTMETNSRVDNILKLFPEYSHSLQKRSAIKRLLKTSNMKKRLRKKKTACSIDEETKRPESSLPREINESSVQEIEAQESIPLNWEKELFGSSSEDLSDSSQISSPESLKVEHIRAQADGKNYPKQLYPDIKSPNDDDLVKGDMQTLIEPLNNRGFLGFDESTHKIPSDELFCKPFLPSKRSQPVEVCNPFHLNKKIFTDEEEVYKKLKMSRSSLFGNTPKKKKAPNSKRKRTASRTDAKQLNKICKVNDSDKILQAVTTSNIDFMTDTTCGATWTTQAEEIISNSMSHNQKTFTLKESRVLQNQTTQEKIPDITELLAQKEKFTLNPSSQDQLIPPELATSTQEGNKTSTFIEKPVSVKQSISIYQEHKTLNTTSQGQESTHIFASHHPPNSFNLSQEAQNPLNSIIQAQMSQNSREFPTHRQDIVKPNFNEPTSNVAFFEPERLHFNGLPISNQEECSISVPQDKIPINSNKSTPMRLNELPALEEFKDFNSLGSLRELRSLEASTIETVKRANDNVSLSPSVSDPEADIPPPKINESSLDLSLLLKMPEEDCSIPQFKIPDSYNKNTFALNKALTNSTENLIEDVLLNENSETNTPKFEVFLDEILNEVAPPLSPISVLAPTEQPLHNESESSCDEEVPKQKTETVNGRKGKRKPPATAAIAVKRSARLKAKNCASTESACSLPVSNFAGIQLGKYTKKKTEQEKPLKKLKEVDKVSSTEEKKLEDRIDITGAIRMGYFKDLMEEEKEHDSSADSLVIDESTNEEEEGDFTKNVAQENKSYDQLKTVTSLCHIPLHVETKINSKELILEKLPEMDSYQKFLPTTETLPKHLELNADEALQRVEQLTFANSSIRSCEDTPPMQEEQNLPDNPPNSASGHTPPLFTSFNECPASPPPVDQKQEESHIIWELSEFAPVATKPTSNSMISHIIANYNPKYHKMLTQDRQTDKKLLNQLQSIISGFTSGLCLVMDSVRTIDTLLNLTTNERLIAQAFIGIVKTAPRPETEVLPPVPELYLSETLRKLLLLLESLHHRLPGLRRNLQSTIEQSLFTFAKDIIPLEVLMNLTQFYLGTIADPAATNNPARLFICKCLYFYNQKATPMIYETLCVYPSVLPKRDDPTYDRSDALINTIQCLLMSTYYDMEKTDMKTRQIFTKLRNYYNYESFKPPREEVLDNLMAKIRAGRFKNVPYAFALICKRMEQRSAEKMVLGGRLLPLANEYYHILSQTTENDEKIACILECISFIIKPFSLDADISTYINLFGRFLNASERGIIQEAALAALLRTIRFGYVHCFNAIYNFKPTYELTNATKAMLRSFIYKKSLDFLKRLEHQAHVLVAT